jgi:hypothetical protein
VAWRARGGDGARRASGVPRAGGARGAAAARRRAGPTRRRRDARLPCSLCVPARRRTRICWAVRVSGGCPHGGQRRHARGARAGSRAGVHLWRAARRARRRRAGVRLHGLRASLCCRGGRLHASAVPCARPAARRAVRPAGAERRARGGHGAELRRSAGHCAAHAASRARRAQLRGAGQRGHAQRRRAAAPAALPGLAASAAAAALDGRRRGVRGAQPALAVRAPAGTAAAPAGERVSRCRCAQRPARGSIRPRPSTVTGAAGRSLALALPCGGAAVRSSAGAAACARAALDGPPDGPRGGRRARRGFRAARRTARGRRAGTSGRAIRARRLAGCGARPGGRCA